MNKIEAEKYVKSKYPDESFNASQAARIYLQEVKGVKFSSVKKINQLSNSMATKHPPKEPKPCPECAEPMFQFPLCPSCDKSGEGWRSVFICKNSVGRNQIVNFDTKQNDTYEKFLILHQVDYPKETTCNQEAILTKEGGM